MSRVFVSRRLFVTLAAVICCSSMCVIPLGCRQQRNDSGAAGGKDGGAGERPALFEEIQDEVGLNFVHNPGRPGTWYYPEIMVMGAALLDYDCDGDLDIYLLNCGDPILPGVARNPADATNRLFRQEANGHFVDVTSASGLGDQGYGFGVAVGDLNNDGFPDIYVTNVGQDRLFLNERNGHFRDITELAGVSNLRWSAAACFVDYDRDGWLDLYVSNYIDYFPSRQCYGPSGRRDYCGPGSFEKTVDKLWHNASAAAAPDHLANADAEGIRFEDVSVTAGIAKRRGSGLGVVAIDFNNDGWQDIYVANDMVANFLWINQHDGTFEDDALLQGVSYDAQGRPQASMGVGVTDINGDQLPDLYVSHMAGEMNVFYESEGENIFRETAAEHGLCVPLHPWTTFGFAFFDIDHDGAEDLAVVNGSMKLPDEAVKLPDFSDRAAYWKIFSEPNMILMNDGHGKYRVRDCAAEQFTSRRETSRRFAWVTSTTMAILICWKSVRRRRRDCTAMWRRRSSIGRACAWWNRSWVGVMRMVRELRWLGMAIAGRAGFVRMPATYPVTIRLPTLDSERSSMLMKSRYAGQMVALSCLPGVPRINWLYWCMVRESPDEPRSARKRNRDRVPLPPVSAAGKMDTPKKRNWRLFYLVIGGILIIGAAWFRLQATSNPLLRMPTIEPEGLLPNVAEAIHEGQAAILKDPDSAEAWGTYGLVLLAHEFRREALVSFQEAERLAPKDYRWSYYVGMTEGVFDAAMAAAAFERAVAESTETELGPLAPRGMVFRSAESRWLRRAGSCGVEATAG